ncbi:thermonuclease family protein [Candidatus Mycalebacterium sp.]
MRNSKSVKWLFLLIALVVLAGYADLPSRFSPEAQKGEIFPVERIVDGDTIRILYKPGHSHPVRLEGIDCPEIMRHDSPGDPFAKEATELLSKLLKNKTVRARFGAERYDRYGRLLAFVFSDGVNVNRKIVEAGLATVIQIGQQDPVLMEELLNAQKTAMRNREGIWSGDGNFKQLRSNERFVVAQSKVAHMEGKRIVIRAEITDSARKRSGTIILKTDGGIEIVIFGGSAANFSHFGIDPRAHYTGKTVRIVGRASMYRSKPNIIVRHPMSISVQE